MRVRFVPIFLVFLAPPDLASAGDLNTSAQLWSEIDVKAALSSNWTATALAVSREADGLPNPTLWGGGLTLDYHIGNWTFTIGDLEAQARIPETGARLDANLPLAAFTYSWQIGNFLMSDRNRIEDLYGVPGNPWRYRNRLEIEYPLNGLGPLSSVFVSTEPFYDLQINQWTRNRAQFGFTLDLIKNAQLQIYYLRQDDRQYLPSVINALGTTLVFELP